MNENALNHLCMIADSHSVYAEDFADQLMSRYTSLGLILAAAVLSTREYIFKPIQCWMPAEWPHPWEEYAENYCWIQNTYNVAFREPGFPGLRARKAAEISYFQWVPFLLAIQSLLVLVPQLLWRLVSARSGSEPHQIVKLAAELDGTRSTQRRRRKLSCYLAAQLRRSILTASRLSEFRQPCCRGKITCTGWLFVSYIAIKIVYVLNGLGQLYMMKAYLGYKDLHFGWSTLQNLLNDQYWQQTGIFPRVTFCDIPIKHVGQWNTRSIQCVLPMNMLNEKIYIFLWFWTVLCMTLQVAYGAYWIFGLVPPSRRLQFMRSLLKLERPDPDLVPSIDARAIKRFTRDHLRLDGVFILQMVAEKYGNLSAARILAQMLVDDTATIKLPEANGHADLSYRSTLPVR